MSSQFASITDLDFETRLRSGGVDLKVNGAHRYSRAAYPILLVYQLPDDDTVSTIECDLDMAPITWRDMPEALRRQALLVKATASKPLAERHVFAAFNAAFDMLIWNAAFPECPLPVDSWIDVMAQTMASQLPPALDGAGKTLGLGGKQDDGKALIARFTYFNSTTKREDPEGFARFVSYAERDVALQRIVRLSTMELTDTEWEDWWVSEEINQRGVGVDVALAEVAARAAASNVAQLNAQLTRWTGGRITAVTQVQRLGQWLYDNIPNEEARRLLVTEWDEDADADVDGDVKPAKLSLRAPQLDALLAYYRTLEEREGGLTDWEWTIVDVVEARRYGGGTAQSKFETILDHHVDGRLCGQYVFNGAPQTGRFSSRGVQVHNLIRASLKAREAAVIEYLLSLA